MKKVFSGALILSLLASHAVMPVVSSAETAAKGGKVQEQNTRGAAGQLRGTIDKIVTVVESLPGDKNKKERRTQLRTIINPRFDFEEMAKRAVGAHWGEASATEQGEFVRVFSDLLATTYLAKIETVRQGMVKIDSEEVQQGKAIVKTTVQNKGETFPIHYRLLEEEGEWKVYDVIIENVGLVVTYRNEFAGIIRKEKMAGLIQRLKEKNANSTV